MVLRTSPATAPATWTFDVSYLSNYGDPTPQCATYTASGEFVLTDGGGTLTYHESGTGAFDGVTGGGTDSGKITGPEARGTYTSSS